jgi:hypothetical protein
MHTKYIIVLNGKTKGEDMNNKGHKEITVY